LKGIEMKNNNIITVCHQAIADARSAALTAASPAERSRRFHSTLNQALAGVDLVGDWSLGFAVMSAASAELASLNT
jgi:hypothetical protein